MKRRFTGTLKQVVKAVRLKPLVANKSDGNEYLSAIRSLLDFRRPNGCDTAIVLHLYYTESWPKLALRLRYLKNIPFDLFITLPATNSDFTKTILQDYPSAIILTVPNRGRDVLPFLRIAAELHRLGYNRLLKLHTKKSTHRTDGAEWFDLLLRSLIPTEKSLVEQLFQVLDDRSTGIVGPAGQYLQLSVNFDANGAHMTRLINIMYSQSVSQRILQTDRNQYGFFAGTMFWLRLDTIEPILQQDLSAKRFELEAGQIDATLAHAVERVLSLVPEIEGRRMYEIDEAGIREISYDAGTVPDWSEVYIGPKG